MGSFCAAWSLPISRLIPPAVGGPRNEVAATPCGLSASLLTLPVPPPASSDDGSGSALGRQVKEGRKEEEMHRISHWVNGSVVPGSSGRSGVVWNPAPGEQAGSVDLCSAAKVASAVAVAKAAFPSWRATNLSRRAEVMFHMRELVDANR